MMKGPEFAARDGAVFALPTELEVAGRRRAIRADYREILNILAAFDDPDLTEAEKAYVCLHNLYVDFDRMQPGTYAEAYRAAVAFIDHGLGGQGGGPRTVDWEQDAPLLFPAVNRAAGYEVRDAAFLVASFVEPSWMKFLRVSTLNSGSFARMIRSTRTPGLSVCSKQ